MHPTPLAPRAHRTRLVGVRVRDLMTPSPVSVRHNATVRDAAAFLAERRIGAVLVVTDAGRAVGVLSRFDVLLAASAGVDGAPVREVMTPAVIAVRPHTPALDALDHMARHAVRRVFVVDDGGIPVGVVSTPDLCRAFAARWSEADLPLEPDITEEFTS